MSLDTIEVVARLIATTGFPIAVATWLLIRTDRLLRELTDALRSLTAAVERIERRRD